MSAAKGRPRVCSPRRARWPLLLAATVQAVALLGCDEAPTSEDPGPLAARIDYEMPSRFAVPDPLEPEGDYEIYVDGDLHPARWPVVLDGCESTGSIVSYHWTVDGGPETPVTGCDDLVYDFPAEGTYTVSLRVVDADGEEESDTSEVVVKDWLIFGLGDSYGSGEGNPDVRATLPDPSEFETAGVARDPAESTAEVELVSADDGAAVWQNRRCHRSAISGQVQAARRLENADRHSSVSFVHLACSGARVYAGLIDFYEGVEYAEGEDLIEPQVERVAQLAGRHEVDALIISIGGNDVNFSSIIEACIVGENCHDRPVLDPAWPAQAEAVCALSSLRQRECLDYVDDLALDEIEIDAKKIFDVHADAQGPDDGKDGIDNLLDNYEALADRINDLLNMDPARVFLTEFPDISRDERGRFCGWDTAGTITEKLYQLPGFTRAEMEWASTYAFARLSATSQEAANLHGWQLVSGISERFRTHGYCSLDTYLMRLFDTFLIQGDQFGVVHPNPPGHRAYADAILETMADQGMP